MANDRPFEELAHSDVRQQQKALLNKKGKGVSERRRLLEATLDKRDFLHYWRDACGGVDGRAPNFHGLKLTAPEIIAPPLNIERKIASCFKGMARSQAIKAGTWFAMSLRMVRDDCFAPADLCQPRTKSAPAGRERIKAVLRGKSAGMDDEADKCVRDMLRRMGGVLDRGTQTVLQDCAWARAYWRSLLVNEAAQELKASDKGRKLDVNDLWRGCRSAAWRHLSEFMIVRLTVLNEAGMRAALLWRLATMPSMQGQACKDFLLNAGARCAGRCPGVMPIDALMEIARQAAHGIKLDDAVAKPPAEKRIYAYTLPAYRDKPWAGHRRRGAGWIKVGETTQDVDERIRRQLGAGSPEKGYTILLNEPARRDDGTTFSDKDVHQALYLGGAVRIASGGNGRGKGASEWFEVTPDELKMVVDGVRAGKLISL